MLDQYSNGVPIKLGSQQKEALKLMQSGANVYLGGAAGSGKSVVLREYFRRCRRPKVVLAPTGMACLNLGLGAATIHRFACIQPAEIIPEGCMPDLEPEREAVIRAADVVIIDEIGLVRADTFQALIDTLDRYPPYSGRQRQLILSGDFAQISPVVTSREVVEQLASRFGGIYPFMTPGWQKANFATVFLTEIHRQKGGREFVDALNALRLDDPCTNFPVQHADGSTRIMNCIDYINSHATITQDPPPDRLVICMTNDRVREIAKLRDKDLPGPVSRYRGKVEGTFSLRPTGMRLYLKRGSRVMLAANSFPKGRGPKYVNGDLGTVIELGDEEVTVYLDRGPTVTVGPKTWRVFDYRMGPLPISGKIGLQPFPIGTFRQLPLRPASAISAHRSQSLTLAGVHLDLTDNPFSSGHLYTALSRVTGPEYLSLSRPITLNDIRLDGHVLDFERACRESMAGCADGSVPV